MNRRTLADTSAASLLTASPPRGVIVSARDPVSASAPPETSLAASDPTRPGPFGSDTDPSGFDTDPFGFDSSGRSSGLPGSSRSFEPPAASLSSARSSAFLRSAVSAVSNACANDAGTVHPSGGGGTSLDSWPCSAYARAYFSALSGGHAWNRSCILSCASSSRLSASADRADRVALSAASSRAFRASLDASAALSLGAASSSSSPADSSAGSASVLLVSEER